MAVLICTMPWFCSELEVVIWPTKAVTRRTAHAVAIVTLPGELADRVPGHQRGVQCSPQVDDVNAVLLGKNKGLHFRVPATSLVPKMNARFQ